MASASESRALQHRLCGFGCFLLFVGAVGVGGMWAAQVRLDRVAQWPSVTGRMVTSEVTTGTVKTGRVIRTTDVAKTVYSFEVNGKSYRGDTTRIMPFFHTQPEGTPEQIVAKYPVGSSVTVYYDPAKPADCMLIPKAGSDARALI